MRRLVLLATALLAASATSAGAASHTHTIPLLQLSVTGEIHSLGPSRIAIGKVSCSIPPKVAVSAGRFVIGDPVKMTCLGGKLDAVKYAPEVATAQSNGPPSTAPPIVATPRPSGPITGFSATFGQINLTTGVVTTSTSGPLSSATGTVDAVDSTSVTVNGLTCTIPSLLVAYGPLSALAVGWTATLTCHSDTGLIASVSARAS